MATFGTRSVTALNTLDHRLAEVLEEAIKHFDFVVLQGHRNEADQNKAFDDGFSKVRYPNGKHNTMPSMAVDVAPYPIDWDDSERFVYLAGWIMGIAAMKGIRLRWGGDWNSDRQNKDERFRDIGHFELVETRTNSSQTVAV